MATQKYIGVPDGVVLCMDTMGVYPKGRFYTSYKREPIHFQGSLDLLKKMESFYDWLNYPFPGTNERSFITKKGSRPAARRIMKERERIMKDEELLDMHGDLGTFIIRVQHRQNASWQGRITWVEKDKTLSFRSVWEMMKMIEGAMEDFKTEEEENMPEWE